MVGEKKFSCLAHPWNAPMERLYIPDGCECLTKSLALAGAREQGSQWYVSGSLHTSRSCPSTR